MRVTFIVTVYNRLDYLRNIMKCLLNQSHKIDELIIADDGSSESVLEAIGDLMPKADFSIKHVYQADLGFRLSKSRNNGAKVAKDGLLIYADQDLIFGKEYIKNIVHNAKKGSVHPHKVLWSTYDEKIKILELFNQEKDYSEILNIIPQKEKCDRTKQNFKDFIRAFKFRFGLRKKPITLGGASFTIFKEDFIKINGFDETFKGHGAEDTDFGFRAQKAGIMPKIIFIKESPIHMNHAKDATVGSNTKQMERIKNNLDVPTYAKYGYNSPLDEDEFTVTVLK